MQNEIHTAEPLVPDPSAFEFEFAIILQSHKSPDIDRIPEELIKAEVENFAVIHKLISIWNKE
jgi:hypothetical protein